MVVYEKRGALVMSNATSKHWKVFFAHFSDRGYLKREANPHNPVFSAGCGSVLMHLELIDLASFSHLCTTVGTFEQFAAL